MNKLLEVKELTYRKNLKTILDNVNLDVDSGKIIALLGENGAGKTTLMRVIVGILSIIKVKYCSMGMVVKFTVRLILP